MTTPQTTSLSMAQRRAMFGGAQGAPASTATPSSSSNVNHPPVTPVKSTPPAQSPVAINRTASLASSGKTSVLSSSPTNNIVMSPHSASGHGGNRFSTMLPLGLDAKLAIPASAAPDTKPDINRIYAGMNVGVGHEEGRKKWWQTLVAGSTRASSKDLDTSQLSDALLNEIEMELEPGHFSRFVPALAPTDFDAMRRILQKEAVASEREVLGPGHAHLVARLFLACERDEKHTLDLFALVTSRLRTYEADAPLWSLLRNDILRLTELLLANPNGAQLCHHFNTLGFDLVDLSDVIVTWFGGLFSAAAFPTEFCLRCVDVLLLPNGGGAEQLVGILYGTLHVLQMKLLECSSSEALFTALADLPAALTKAQIGEVFAQAFWIHGKCAVKNELDWATLIQQVQGPLRFQSIEMIKAMSGGGAALPPSSAAPSSASLLSQPLHSSTHSPSKAGLVGGGGPNASTPSASGQGHHHSASMTFNLSDYSPESRKASAAAQPQSDATSTTPANASDSTTKPAGKGDNLARGSVSGAPVPSSAATHDVSLIAEMTAATSGNKSPAQLQALLERALKELKLQSQQHRSSAPTPTIISAPGAALTPILATPTSTAQTSVASTSISSGHSVSSSSSLPSPNPAAISATDVSESIRNMHSSVYQIAPLEVHPLDRTSGSTVVKKVVPSNGIIKYSEILEYQMYPCVLMQGYLMKSRAPSKLFKRRGSSGFFGNLHRRYFMLQGSFLTYFKTHEYTKPTRDESVDLRTCVATKIKNHEYGPFAFKIESKEKGSVVYLLFASNETVRDVWLECLAQATQVPALGV